MELVRAKMFIEEYNASGFREHEAEVSFLRKIRLKENEKFKASNENPFHSVPTFALSYLLRIIEIFKNKVDVFFYMLRSPNLVWH